MSQTGAFTLPRFPFFILNLHLEDLDKRRIFKKRSLEADMMHKKMKMMRPTSRGDDDHKQLRLHAEFF